MTKLLVALPIFIPLATASLSLLAWKSVFLQRLISYIGGASLLIASIALVQAVDANGILVMQIGDWSAPYGITFVADRLSAIMVLVSGVIGMSIIVYSASVGERYEVFGYHPLIHVLMMGVCGAFLTGDIFNLYVWFEVMLISSFVLMALGGSREQLEGSIKYVTLNVVSSAIFLAAIGILYGVMGTLNMADLAVKVGELESTGTLTAASMLFFVAFGIKAGVFPLFFWLPASYHTPPAAVSALFAGLLTKVGVYSLIRVFTLIFTHEPELYQTLLLFVAGLTMVTGVLGAAAQFEFRRILSFHIISQIGYMIMGLALMTPLGLAGSVFYLVHHIIVKTNLFLISGIVNRLRGTYQIKPLGGLYLDKPWLAILFMIPAFSLAGFPPLSGFWAKFILVKEGLETEHYYITAAALAVSLLTIYSMVKIWDHVFWKQPPEPVSEDQSVAGIVSMSAAVAALAAITIYIGLFPQSLYAFSERAGQQLLEPALYIEAVLGAAK